MLGERISYVHDFGIVRNFESGELTATGNELDMAIHGDGFFVIDHDKLGEVYSRNGKMQLNADGMIVNSGGHPVMSTDNQPMFIAPNEQKISTGARRYALDGERRSRQDTAGALRGQPENARIP